MKKTNDKLKICIIATHSFPIPMKDLHTGDIVILELAKSLKDMGHDVSLCAPSGTDFEKLIPMRCSYGKYPPSSEECELEAFYNHDFSQYDVVHDFSNTKMITHQLNRMGFKNTCQTLLGGPWRQSVDPHNLILWSNAQKSRVLQGFTDFHNMINYNLGGEDGNQVKDAHVVYGGINTGFYCPDKYQKEDYYLWMGRWHDVRGFNLAIQIAKQSGIKLILAGEHPDNEMFQTQKEAALQAVELARGYKNIEFRYLPKDPDHHTIKRELYRGAKAFLYTVQFNEPFGLSQIESLACGTPVIAPNFGSCPELIYGKTGIIVENTLSEYCNALNKVKDIDPVQCRKYAAKNFDIRCMAKNYLKEYTRIIEKGEKW